MSDVILHGTLCEPYAEDANTHKCYAISNLKIQLRAGLDSQCSFEAVGIMHTYKENDKNIQDTKFTHTAITSNQYFDEALPAFGYGRKFFIKLAPSKEGEDPEILFIGFVKNTGTSVVGGVKSLSTSIKVTLATAPYFYDNEWATLPYMMNKGDQPFSKDLPRSIAAAPVLYGGNAPEASKNKLNILDYVVSTLDRVEDSAAPSNVPWGRLANFIDTKTAPSLPFPIKDGKPFTDIQGAIRSAVDKQSGVQIVLGVIANYFLTLVPRFSSDDIKYKAIVNCGVAKQDKDTYTTLTTGDIFSYTEYLAQRRPNNPTAVVVRYRSPDTQGLGTTQLVKITCGYDNSGKAFKITEDFNALNAKVTKSGGKAISNTLAYTELGRYNVISIPTWAASLPDQSKLAKALCNSVIGTGGGFAGSMGLDCPIHKYRDVKNLLGSVIKIECSPSVVKSPVNRFGRLVGVDYTISDNGDSLNASLVLTLDCVLSSADFDIFSIDKHDLLCTDKETK